MARAIGVMLMSEAGITDWNTLSAVNRLSKDDDAGFFIKGGKGKAAAKFVYVFVNPTFDDFMKKNPNEIAAPGGVA